MHNTMECLNLCLTRKDFKLVTAVIKDDKVHLSFTLVEVGTNHVLLGERTFRLHTRFKDGNDFIRELWLTEDFQTLNHEW